MRSVKSKEKNWRQGEGLCKESKTISLLFLLLSFFSNTFTSGDRDRESEEDEEGSERETREPVIEGNTSPFSIPSLDRVNNDSVSLKSIPGTELKEGIKCKHQKRKSKEGISKRISVLDETRIRKKKKKRALMATVRTKMQQKGSKGVH